MLKRNKGDPNKFGSPLFGARNGTWTRTVWTTRPSNVRVCQFRHSRVLIFSTRILYHIKNGLSIPFLKNIWVFRYFSHKDYLSENIWLRRLYRKWYAGLTNPYLRALFSAIILCSARAQMIAVASNSKGFGVFYICTNTKGDDLGHRAWRDLRTRICALYLVR